MKNKLLIILILLLMLIPINIYALEYPSINSKNVEIYDLNDKKILYEIKSNDKAAIASLTKIATTITAIENITNLEEEVTITNSILSTVRWDASKAGLKAGDKVTYKDLLYAAMLPSGADATNSIAILSSGSIENYIKKMNGLAKKLKLKNTHFANSTGLDDPDHYSTTDDVRILLEYALQNKTFREVYTTKNYKLSNGLKVKSTLNKYNAPDDLKNIILGSKTGYTGDAGYCLSSLSNINGHEMIIIVLNAEHTDKYYHLEDTFSLLNFLNTNFKEETLVEKNKLIKTLPVTLSKQTKYNIYSDKKVTKYLPSDYDKDKLKVDYKGLKELSFNNKKGKSIGTIKYSYDNKLLYEQNVILNKELKIDFIKVLKKYFYIPLILILIIILILIKPKKKKKRKKNK